MRLSRGCYDKFHRCPGWNGGGPKYAKVRRCANGRIQVDYAARAWHWRFWSCNKCDVVVWPYVTRYLSVPYLAGEVSRWVRDIPYRWRHR